MTADNSVARGPTNSVERTIVAALIATALKDSDLTWDELTLDRWLTNPSALVPGTKMFFRLIE